MKTQTHTHTLILCNVLLFLYFEAASSQSNRQKPRTATLAIIVNAVGRPLPFQRIHNMHALCSLFVICMFGMASQQQIVCSYVCVFSIWTSVHCIGQNAFDIEEK